MILLSFYKVPLCPIDLLLITLFLIVNFVHTLNKNKSCTNENKRINMDMAKAYDRTKWFFIEFTLKVIDFLNFITHTIRKCITSITFFILINNKNSKITIPTRDFRQEDLLPLIYLLFVLKCCLVCLPIVK